MRVDYIYYDSQPISDEKINKTKQNKLAFAQAATLSSPWIPTWVLGLVSEPVISLSYLQTLRSGIVLRICAHINHSSLTLYCNTGNTYMVLNSKPPLKCSFHNIWRGMRASSVEARAILFASFWVMVKNSGIGHYTQPCEKVPEEATLKHKPSRTS